VKINYADRNLSRLLAYSSLFIQSAVVSGGFPHFFIAEHQGSIYEVLVPNIRKALMSSGSQTFAGLCSNMDIKQVGDQQRCNVE